VQHMCMKRLADAVGHDHVRGPRVVISLLRAPACRRLTVTRPETDDDGPETDLSLTVTVSHPRAGTRTLALVSTRDSHGG